MSQSNIGLCSNQMCFGLLVIRENYILKNQGHQVCVTKKKQHI